MEKQRIAIGCDHAGFEYKEFIKNDLTAKGYEVKDFGTYSTDSVDYPDFVHPFMREREWSRDHGKQTFRYQGGNSVENRTCRTRPPTQ